MEKQRNTKNVYIYINLSISTRFPTPAHGKHPQTIIFPPPYFTVFWIWQSWSSSLYFLQTLIRFFFCPNNSNLLSSVHRTFFQKSNDIFTYFRANCKHFFLLVALMKGRLRANRLCKFASLNLRRTMQSETLRLMLSWISLTVILDFFNFSNYSFILPFECSFSASSDSIYMLLIQLTGTFL